MNSMAVRTMLGVAMLYAVALSAADLDRTSSRPAEIQLLDAASGKPATDAILATADAPPPSPAAAMTALRNVISRADANGRLTIPATDAEALVILPALWPTPGDRLQRSVDANTLDAVDLAYAPVVIARDVIETRQPIRLATTTFHRAHVRFPVDVCQKTFFYDIALIALDSDHDEAGEGDTAMLGRLECGTNFTVSGLLPGRYRIEILQEYATSDDRDWARLPFEVTARNVALVVGK